MSKLLSYLGLAMRAGKLVTGEEGAMGAVRSGEARLIIIAEDAGNHMRKQFTNKCTHYNIPIVQHYTREQLGSSIGKGQRVVIAVCDQGFANMMMKVLEKQMEV